MVKVETTLGRKALSRTTLIRMTLSRITLSRTSLGRITISRMIFTRMTEWLAYKDTVQSSTLSIKCYSMFNDMLSVLMLNFRPACLKHKNLFKMVKV